MDIFEYIKFRLGELIGKNKIKRLNGVKEEKNREDFKNRIRENPVYSKNSLIYNILKHYKLSEDFARDTVVQEAIVSIIERKIYDIYKLNDLNRFSVDEIINLLEGEITVSPNNITIRHGMSDETSDKIDFINILKTRKAVRIIEEETEVYKNYAAIHKKYKEYNKYNVLVKINDETEIKDKQKKCCDIHNKIGIVRNEDNPFIVSYESEDIIEGSKFNGRGYYSNVDSCIDLEEIMVYENGYTLKDGENNIPDYCICRLIREMEALNTYDARNFLSFCEKEYPEMFKTKSKFNDFY